MTLLTLIPPVVYAVALAVLIWSARAGGTQGSWRLVIALGIGFIGFTLWTLAQDGVIQFWLNHTTNLSGNQVWLDLLIAVTLAFVLLVPRARAQGMQVLPWALAVAATASIALLLMLARLLWLEDQARRRAR